MISNPKNGSCILGLESLAALHKLSSNCQAGFGYLKVRLQGLLAHFKALSNSKTFSYASYLSKKSSAKIQMQNLGQHAVKVNLGFLNFFHCKEAHQGVFF